MRRWRRRGRRSRGDRILFAVPPPAKGLKRRPLVLCGLCMGRISLLDDRFSRRSLPIHFTHHLLPVFHQGVELGVVCGARR